MLARLRPHATVAALVWTGVMLVGLLAPTASADVAVAGVDKLVHVVIFAVFAGLWTLARGWKTALVLALLFAPLTEWLQGFVGRDMDALDALADVAGAAAGVGVGLRAQRALRRAGSGVA